MTTQISDTFHYREKSRKLAGVNGSGLFDPAQHGIQPRSFSTACWRGYFCTYLVEDGGLFLTEAHLGLLDEGAASAERGEGPKLFGKVPRRYLEHGSLRNMQTGEVKTSWESTDFKVDEMREPVPFTGGLLLGDDLIAELYVRMGFQQAYKFRDVYELIFDSGRQVEEHDRSAQMAEFREMIGAVSSLAPDRQASLEQVMDEVKQCFSLKYTGFGG